MRIRAYLATSLLLASCGHRVASPDEVLPLDLPSQWSEATDASGAPLASTWWTAFEAQELNELIPRVWRANPDLMIARAALRQTEAMAEIAGAARWPSASAGLQAGRSRQNLIGLPFPGAGDVLPITNSSFALSLDLAWELELWGRVDAAVDAAESELLASQAELEAAQLSLAGQAVQVWLARTEAQLQVEIAAEMRALAEQRLDHLEARFDRGTATASQLLDAQQAVTAWQSRTAQLTLSLDAQKRALQTLLGEYPVGLSDDLVLAEAVLPELPGTLPAGAPATLLSRRPDLAAAEARYYAATAREREARASLYPRLALTSSGGTSSNDLGDLLDGDFRVWSLAGGLTAPLFEGGRLRANVDANAAGAEAAAWTFARDFLRALGEVEAGLRAEQSLQQQLRDQLLNESRAARQGELAERRFRSGTGSLLDWIDARSGALEARSQRLALQLQLLQNRTSLYLALGGGFDSGQADER